MSTSKTSLLFHLKENHFWFDLVCLILIWVLVYQAPQNFFLFTNIPIGFFLKILAIVSSLEFFSFISYHLFGSHSSLLLQGFLGGFISSTTVFVQLIFDKKFKNTNMHILSISLLMAICSMLIECLLIVATVTTHLKLIYLMPFGLMLLFILISIILLCFSNKEKEISHIQISNLEIEDPIIWKKALLFSLYIILLKYLLFFLQKLVGLPILIGSFLASFFEAHVILAVNLGSVKAFSPVDEIIAILLVVLLGSLLSKILFVLKGKMLTNKKLVILPISISFILTTFITLIASEIFKN